jgi:hypothetical protein
MHIDTITSKQRGKVYTSILLRETFREGKRIRHRTLANLSHLPPATITLMRESLAGRIVSFTNKTDLCLTSAREYGASKALLDLARQLELHKIIYSRPEPWRESALAMIIGRIVFQGSKLSLVAQHRNSALWSLCGIEKPDVDQHCYETLDKLLARQGAIQAALIKRHLSDGCFVLYDLTTIWLEGDYDDSSLADYGYSKEGRRGNKQVLLGVLTNKDGIPVAGEVFRGNTAEQTTVLAKARLLAKENGIADLVLVADRGLLTPARIAEVKAEGMHAITALTHPQFRRLLRQGVIRPELFIPGEVVEVAPADEPGVRYLLCHNPLRADADSRRRADILLTVMLQLEDLTESNMRSTDALAAAVGALLAKYKVAK